MKIKILSTSKEIERMDTFQEFSKTLKENFSKVDPFLMLIFEVNLY
jgi:hypothetical protein